MAGANDILTQIQQKRSVDQTFSGGGHPHTYVELLFDGKIIPMQYVEPEVYSFRHNYYYNSSDNILYIKKAEWVDLFKEFNKEDDEFVYFNNNRSVKKMVNEPDPKNFGDKYYYNTISNKVFGRTLCWIECTNL